MADRVHAAEIFADHDGDLMLGCTGCGWFQAVDEGPLADLHGIYDQLHVATLVGAHHG